MVGGAGMPSATATGFGHWLPHARRVLVVANADGVRRRSFPLAHIDPAAHRNVRVRPLVSAHARHALSEVSPLPTCARAILRHTLLPRDSSASHPQTPVEPPTRLASVFIGGIGHPAGTDLASDRLAPWPAPRLRFSVGSAARLNRAGWQRAAGGLAAKNTDGSGADAPCAASAGPAHAGNFGRAAGLQPGAGGGTAQRRRGLSSRLGNRQRVRRAGARRAGQTAVRQPRLRAAPHQSIQSPQRSRAQPAQRAAGRRQYCAPHCSRSWRMAARLLALRRLPRSSKPVREQPLT